MDKLSSKVFVCGVDAMDPRLTRKYIDMGLMPNAKKMLERGAAREESGDVRLYAYRYSAAMDYDGYRRDATGAWDYFFLSFGR